MNLNLTMVVQAIVFALFIWFTVKLAWPLFLSKVDARTKTIADGLAEAERGRSSLAEAQKQTDAMLKEARARAQEIVAARNGRFDRFLHRRARRGAPESGGVWAGAAPTRPRGPRGAPGSTGRRAARIAARRTSSPMTARPTTPRSSS